ncbi:MAG: hypothetical protein RL685_5184 [Pseudomonadota bacterium]|jgi:hypothetical protein
MPKMFHGPTHESGPNAAALTRFFALHCLHHLQKAARHCDRVAHLPSCTPHCRALRPCNCISARHRRALRRQPNLGLPAHSQRILNERPPQAQSHGAPFHSARHLLDPGGARQRSASSRHLSPSRARSPPQIRRRSSSFRSSSSGHRPPVIVLRSSPSGHRPPIAAARSAGDGNTPRVSTRQPAPPPVPPRRFAYEPLEERPLRFVYEPPHSRYLESNSARQDARNAFVLIPAEVGLYTKCPGPPFADSYAKGPLRRWGIPSSGAGPHLAPNALHAGLRERRLASSLATGSALAPSRAGGALASGSDAASLAGAGLSGHDVE